MRTRETVLWFFFFTHKTAYEVRISYWSSDVCSSDLEQLQLPDGGDPTLGEAAIPEHKAYEHAEQGHIGQPDPGRRSEERRVGNELSVRVDLGGRRIINKKN